MDQQPEQTSAIVKAARTGYDARGVIYLFVGGLAVDAAVGGGGKTTGSKGAMISMLQQPFGKILLGLIALGLVFYSIWRFIQAVKDVDHHGTDAKGIAVYVTASHDDYGSNPDRVGSSGMAVHLLPLDEG